MTVGAKLARCFISWQVLSTRDLNTIISLEILNWLNIQEEMGLVFLFWSVNYHNLIQVWRKMRKHLLQSPAQNRANMSSDEVAWDFFPVGLEIFQGWRDYSASHCSLFHCFIVQAVKKNVCVINNLNFSFQFYACCLPISYYTPLSRTDFIFSVTSL